MADSKKNPSGVNAEDYAGDAPLKAHQNDYRPEKPMAIPSDATSPTLISPGLMETDLARLSMIHEQFPPEDHSPALDPTPLDNAPSVIYTGSMPMLNPLERPSQAHVVAAVDATAVNAEAQARGVPRARPLGVDGTLGTDDVGRASDAPKSVIGGDGKPVEIKPGHK